MNRPLPAVLAFVFSWAGRLVPGAPDSPYLQGLFLVIITVATGWFIVWAVCECVQMVREVRRPPGSA